MTLPDRPDNTALNTELPKAPTVVATIRYALGDWIAVISVVVSSFAFISLLVRIFDIGISQILLSALTWYREIFHGLLDYLLWFLPFKLTALTKDVLTYWLVAGGLLARTNAFLATEEIRFQTLQGYSEFRRRTMVATAIPKVFAKSLLIWPLQVVSNVLVPYVYWTHTFGKFFRVRSHSSSALSKFDMYRFDMRVLLAVYATTMISAAAVFFALNAMLPSVR